MSDSNRIPIFKSVAFGLALSLLGLSASANTELDRKYALETVGYLRSWDNMDGLFADYVSGAFKEYFQMQSRFTLQDLSKADPILLKSKLPYNKVIDDSAVLSQLARSLRSQTVIKTKVTKEGPQYRFVLTWLHAPQMDVLATETLVMREDENKGLGMDALRHALKGALDRMINKVPFFGTVTGRDEQAVTINVGTLAGLRPGDRLVIGTLEEVKRHPLLKEVVDWRFTETGKLEVQQVEDGIGFCKIVAEQNSHPIARGQKIVQMIKRPVTVESAVINERELELAALKARPTLGYVTGGVMIGGFSRQASKYDAATGKDQGRTGGGFVIGPSAQSELWLTRNWFVNAGFGYGFWKYTQQDLVTGEDTELTGASGSLTTFKIAAGYSYLMNGSLYGPKGWVKFGFRSTSYSLPVNTTEQTAPSTYKSPLVGIGAELPLRDNYGGLLNLEFGMMTSATETAADTVNGVTASDVAFFLGGYYRVDNRLMVRMGFDVLANSVTFEDNKNVSQKTITFGPSLQYYF